MWQGSKSGGEIIFNSHYYPHSNAIFGDKFLYVTCDNAILRILMFRPRTFFEGYKIFSLQVTKTRNNRGVLLPNIYAALKISVTMFRNKKSHWCIVIYLNTFQYLNLFRIFILEFRLISTLSLTRSGEK